MANIKPFAALRYDFSNARDPKTVCCPPYDIIPDASEWTSKNPYNAILLEGGERLGTENPYNDAKNTLDKWLSEGILREDDPPAFYLYEASFSSRDGSTRTLRGLAALLELTPFSEGVVLPHEFTLSAAKEDRRRLMLETGCQFSPVYGLYDDPEGKVEDILRPALDMSPADGPFTMPDGVTHSLRVVSDAKICNVLTDTFRDKKIFIADGHHRYETLLRLREETGKPQYAMIFLADMNGAGVEIWPTHRVLSSLDGYDEAKIRSRLEESYTVSETDAAPEDGTFVWITPSGMRKLTPKNKSQSKSSVEALHSDILEPLFGINAENMANQRNLTYTRDIAEATQLVRDGKAQCSFLLPPTKLSELRDTVLAGEKMPQKSTYFFPKIITGLFMHKFE